MYKILIVIISFSVLPSCKNISNPQVVREKVIIPESEYLGDDSFINPSGQTVETRFDLPVGYSRIGVLPESYESFLRKLTVKPHDSKVHLYNGDLKSNQSVHDGVIDLDIGSKDLHQCADAIIRVRADYLWVRKKYDQIHFNFTNGHKVDYSEWMKGRRMIVEGNKTYWDQTNYPSNTYEDYWEYLELIFMYAGTLSLSKELKSEPIKEMKIGDVFIQGGSPGHAVVIVDMATNNSGQKIFLLAQSYMPAQELHVLKTLNESIGPWYTLNNENEIYTPEWIFSSSDLKRFKD